MSDSVRVAGSPEERFVVIGSLPGGVGLEVTAGNHTVSAAAVTQFWRDRGAVADWQLRADLAHSRPVLLLTRPASVSRVTHATELVPGKPAASHTETLCGMVLDWPGGLRICSEYEGWTPCPGCIGRVGGMSRVCTSRGAPRCCRSGPTARVTGRLEPPGVAGSRLRGSAGTLLHELAGLYLHRLSSDLAAAELARLDPTELHFAWEGPLEPGRGHYYRIQAPSLLIEYDNTSHQANHVHALWRRPGEDFGESLLARHYAAEHTPPD